MSQKPEAELAEGSAQLMLSRICPLYFLALIFSMLISVFSKPFAHARLESGSQKLQIYIAFLALNLRRREILFHGTDINTLPPPKIGY